jgi:2-polyprenyl-3-methyl-5-hydroxy-6-metoxy-1,4-benzoquinol methylase
MDEFFIKRTMENSIPQSQVFCVEILPLFWTTIRKYPHGNYTLLDVGPGAGGGAELLASIHRSNFLGYKIAVETLDISSLFNEFIHTYCPNITKANNCDLFEFTSTYDFVICSHVIEHVNGPLLFINELKKHAKYNVFVTAPFAENLDNASQGHINSFAQEFIDLVEHDHFSVRDSFGWQGPGRKVFDLIIKGCG